MKLVSNTGYKGRQGIYEILVVSKPLKEAILRKATTPELETDCCERRFSNHARHGQEG